MCLSDVNFKMRYHKMAGPSAVVPVSEKSCTKNDISNVDIHHVYVRWFDGFPNTSITVKLSTANSFWKSSKYCEIYQTIVENTSTAHKWKTSTTSRTGYHTTSNYWRDDRLYSWRAWNSLVWHNHQMTPLTALFHKIFVLRWDVIFFKSDVNERASMMLWRKHKSWEFNDDVERVDHQYL
jgi:hypothetical protein